MKENFWKKLKKPIFALAPMANVTDAAFRSIIARYGKPDVMWTEFVSVDGLLSAGRDKLLVDLNYSDEQRPIVAQIFGAVPENFEKVTKLLLELGFDGIDINMGCPDKSVIQQRAGAACIKDHKLAAEIIEAAKKGSGGLPVSVKTRLGFGKVEIDSWILSLLQADLAAITVHLRTVKEMSKVPAHWELMPQIVELANQASSKPVILGNGDVMSLSEGQAKVEQTGCDGIMFGRAIFGNPWLFDQSKPAVSNSERMQAMLEHAKLFEEMYSKSGVAGKNFEVMKKHFKAYVNGFDGAKELRIKLMEAESYKEVEAIVLEHYPVLSHKSLA